MTTFAFSPSAAFDALPTTSSEGDGVVVQDRDGLGLATVLLRRGQSAAFTQRVRERFGIELESGARRSASGGTAFLAIGPGAWLATSEGGVNVFAAGLAEAVGESASVSDQSDGYAVLRVSGHGVREALCKLAPIDLHPRAFKVNDVAVTVAAHIGTTWWRLEDAGNGSAVFELAVYRSLAGSVWGALSASAAQFGYRRHQ